MKAVVKLRGLSFLLLLTFWFSAELPALHAFVTIPLRVRFTGVLLPDKDQSRKGALEDFYVFIGKEKRIFRLDKMEVVGSVEPNRTILQRLFPPLVRFVGPDDLIRRLKSLDIVGKVLAIEGLLYPESRMLFLTAVDESEAADNDSIFLAEK